MVSIEFGEENTNLVANWWLAHRAVIFVFLAETAPPIRAAQTGVLDLDIRISNRPFIHICKSFAAQTGLKYRNVEKRINAV
jgi:hypothetical protein